MGCWNWTCFWSNLPIEAGNRCVLIPIIQNKYIETNKPLPGTVIYPREVYEVCWPVMRWSYNDQGWIDNIDPNISSDIFLKTINDLVINTKGFQFEEADVITWFDNLEQFINDWLERWCSYKWQTISFVLMHEDIFDAVWDTYGEKNLKKNIKEFDKNLAERVKALDITEWMNDWIKKSLESIWQKDKLNNIIRYWIATFPFIEKMTNNYWFDIKNLDSSVKFIWIANSLRRTIFPSAWSGSQAWVDNIWAKINETSRKKAIEISDEKLSFSDIPKKKRNPIK